MLLSFHKNEEIEANLRVEELGKKGCKFLSDTGYKYNNMREICITDNKKW